MMRTLIACGMIGPPLFVAVFVIAGAVRPGYNPRRQFVSALCEGRSGWIQVANFLVFGLLMIGFAVGLHAGLRSGSGARAAPLLFGVFGGALVMAGVFVGDPKSWRGMLHGLAGIVVFLLSLPAASIVMGARFSGPTGSAIWAAYSFLTGVAVPAFFVAAVRDAARNIPESDSQVPAGLLQRISILIGWTWIFLLARRLMGAMS